MKWVYIIGVFLVLAVLLLVGDGTADSNDELPRVYEYPLAPWTDTTVLRSVVSVKRRLASLDSVSRDSVSNRRGLSDALTVRLLRSRGGMSAELDSLLKIVQWAEQFRVLSLAEPRDRLFYVSVYDFWMDRVSETLVRLSERQPSVRHSFKFRYLVARCEENSYIVAAKVSSAEKLVGNIRYGNWMHLFRATWYQSSWWMKLGFLLLLVFIGVGMVSLGRFVMGRFVTGRFVTGAFKKKR